MAQSPLARMPLVSLCVLALVASAVVLLRPGVPNVGAQDGYRISVDQVIVSEKQDKVTALVSVFDPAGQSVRDLKDFTALIDGTTVPVESVKSIVNEREGVSVLLLMDISGSMEGEPLRQARDAAKTLVQGLLPQDSAALMLFAGSVSNETDFALARDALVAQIDTLATQPGGTALYQAVVQGLAGSAQAPTTRRAIVLLTDGQESGASQASRDAALSAAAGDNIPIFTIGLGPDADAGLLQAIASASHGSFFLAPTPADLSQVFDAVAGHLRSQYQIVLPAPQATFSARTLVIETRVGQVVLRAEGHFTTVAPAPKPTNTTGPPRWIWPAVIALIVPILALAARRFRRRPRALKSPLPGGPGSDLALPARAQSPEQATGPGAGRLTIVEGPGAGQHVIVSAAPIDIGTDPSCELRLEAVDRAIAGRHARVWLQHDRLIVHRLALGRSTSVEDPAVEWASLEENEALRIGPYLLAFSLEHKASEQSNSLSEA
jgi:uncharacterized protein YegL